MKFNWEGFTALGQQKTGSLEAESEGEAAGKLRGMGIMAQNIQAEGSEPFKTVFPNSTEWKQPEAAYPVEDRRNPIIENPYASTGVGFSGIPGPSVLMECMNCHGSGKMGGEVCSNCNGIPHRTRGPQLPPGGFSGTQGPPIPKEYKKAQITERPMTMECRHPNVAWQENLRMNLADIKIVIDCAREFLGSGIHIPFEPMQGVQEAEREMVKQAIMKALKDLRAA